MFYDMQLLKQKYKGYKNINQKISFEEKKGNLIRINRGFYTDDIINDGKVIANICYSPSYLSFEYALSQYGLIPEYVSSYTSAVFGKCHNKVYSNKNINLQYFGIPNEVYSDFVLSIKDENGINYLIASKEKALCDELYRKYPVRSIKDLEIMLYDDLRLDYEDLKELNFQNVLKIIPKYHSNTLNVFGKYIKKEFLSE